MRTNRTDWIILGVAVGLAIFGTLMVYSASAMIAHRETGGESQFTYFYKQLIFTAVGIVLMYLASRVDYRRLNHPIVVVLGLVVTVGALIAVFGFPEINGARRWIRFGALSVQPAEIAKITLPVFLAYLFTRNEDRIGEVVPTVLPSLVVVGVFSVLILLQPDLGTMFVLGAIFGIVYFAAGARLIHVGAVGAGMAAIGAAMVYTAPWRVNRLMAFLDPFKHSDDAGYQVVQSLYAIGSGGVLGEGFARGQQKLFYLPYPYSDFIFSVVGEELGLVGTLAVVLAFGVLLWRGALAAMRAPDRFGMLLGIGLITGITVQAFFNMSVVISILPAKGIPLPFISYGGSSVVVSLLAVGILLNIARKGNSSVPDNGGRSPRRKKSKTGLK